MISIEIYFDHSMCKRYTFQSFIH